MNDKKPFNRIVEILMERDGLTFEEARMQYNEFLELARSSDVTDIEELLHDELQLEPDYIMDVIDDL